MQMNYAARGSVFAVQKGDLYMWTYHGDPAYRMQPVDPWPAELTQTELTQTELTQTEVRRFPGRLLDGRYEVVNMVGRTSELGEFTE